KVPDQVPAGGSGVLIGPCRATVQAPVPMLDPSCEPLMDPLNASPASLPLKLSSACRILMVNETSFVLTVISRKGLSNCCPEVMIFASPVHRSPARTNVSSISPDT